MMMRRRGSVVLVSGREVEYARVLVPPNLYIHTVTEIPPVSPRSPSVTPRLPSGIPHLVVGHANVGVWAELPATHRTRVLLVAELWLRLRLAAAPLLC